MAERRSDEAGEAAVGEYRVVAIEEIQVPEGANPRQHFDPEALAELAESVRQHGILEPLVVRPSARGGYELVAGERRLRAALEAGLTAVPVVVRELTDAEADELRLVENLQRQDLNPVEEAEAVRRLLERHGFTQEQLAARLGKSQPWVSNRLRLLELPGEVRDLISRGMLSAAAGRELLRLADHPERLVRLARRAAERGWTTRQLEEQVRWELNALEWERQREEERRREAEDAEARARREAERAAQVAALEERLRRQELERARVEAVVAAVVDHLAPRAESPVLWAVLATVLARGSSQEHSRLLYRMAGLENVDSPMYALSDEEAQKLVSGLTRAPVAELRKLAIRCVLGRVWEVRPFAEQLFEALPDAAREQVRERVERARERIWGHDLQLKDAAGPGKDDHDARVAACPECGVGYDAGEFCPECGVCPDCCGCTGDPEAPVATGPGSNVSWILNCSVGDVNWTTALRRLTDDELRYCLEHERRATALRRLRAEARRRGLEVPNGSEAVA